MPLSSFIFSDCKSSGGKYSLMGISRNDEREFKKSPLLTNCVELWDLCIATSKNCFALSF